MDWTTEESDFDSRQEQEISLFSTGSRAALGPTQPLIQWIPGDIPPPQKSARGVKLPIRCHLTS
jgi:hypothetical protein